MIDSIGPRGAAEEDGRGMQVLHHRDYPVHPWRNGRGILRHIAEGDGWQLRLADITESGPFSDFSGHLRLFAMVEGAVVLEMAGGERVECDPASPVAIFDGGAAPHCTLVRGPAKAFNLIVEPGKVLAGLERLTIGQSGFEAIGDGGALLAVHVQSGPVECRQRRPVWDDPPDVAGPDGSPVQADSQDTLLPAEGARVMLRAATANGQAVVLLARIRPLTEDGC